MSINCYDIFTSFHIFLLSFIWCIFSRLEGEPLEGDIDGPKGAAEQAVESVERETQGKHTTYLNPLLNESCKWLCIRHLNNNNMMVQFPYLRCGTVNVMSLKPLPIHCWWHCGVVQFPYLIMFNVCHFITLQSLMLLCKISSCGFLSNAKMHSPWIELWCKSCWVTSYSCCYLLSFAGDDEIVYEYFYPTRDGERQE